MNQENRNSNQYVPSPHVQLKFRWNTHVNPNTSVVLHSREDGIFAINPMYDAKNSFHIAEYQLISLNQSLDIYETFGSLVEAKIYSEKISPREEY
jgi:hypothetical protein